MVRPLQIAVWVLVAGLFVGCVAGWAPAIASQADPATAGPPSGQGNSQQQPKTNAASGVPPDVKLVPQIPPAAPPKPFHFPKAASKTLENGLRVFVVTDHRNPAIAARLVLPSAGSLHDPPEMPGVAEMTANLLTQGTEKRSALQIAETIDFVGGSLAAAASKDDTSVTLDVVKKDAELGMELMSDVVLHPTFKQDELDRQREQLLSNLEVQYSDAEYLATAVFLRVVYGSAAYGLPSEGTPETVRKLTRDALAQFHDANYVPSEALLAFAGDITSEEAFGLAAKYFGGWTKKEAPSAAVAAPEALSGIRFWLIDKPDAVQTQIRVGKPGVRRDSPDYVPLLVTNRIFGGGFNSRLNTEVRVKKGLTYGASSSFNALKYAGSFRAGTFTRTETTVEATKLVVDLIAKMSTGEVTSGELNFARDYLAGVYPIQSETAQQVADRVLTVAEYGLPADYNDVYPEKILAVNADQVKAMANRYLDANGLDIVLVGNVGKFRDALKGAFPDAQWEEIPFDQLDLLSADLRRPKPSEAAATPEAIERGNEILKAAAEAAGGDSLRAVDSLELTASGKAFSPQGEIPIELKLVVSYPEKMRSELKLSFGTVVQGFDGESGWMQSPQGAMSLPADFSGEFKRSVALTGGWGLYRQALSGDVKAQSLGEEEIEGKKLPAVEWNAPNGPVKLYFDPESHLLVAAHFTSLSLQGSIETDQRWSDFRSVNGRQYPFHTIVFRGGSKFSETTVQIIQVNTKPDPAIFSKPQ